MMQQNIFLIFPLTACYVALELCCSVPNVTLQIISVTLNWTGGLGFSIVCMRLDLIGTDY